VSSRGGGTGTGPTKTYGWSRKRWAPRNKGMTLTKPERSPASPPGAAPIAEDERNRLPEELLELWTADTRFLLDQFERLNAGDSSGRVCGRRKLDSVWVAGQELLVRAPDAAVVTAAVAALGAAGGCCA